MQTVLKFHTLGFQSFKDNNCKKKKLLNLLSHFQFTLQPCQNIHNLFCFIALVLENN